MGGCASTGPDSSPTNSPTTSPTSTKSKTSKNSKQQQQSQQQQKQKKNQKTSKQGNNNNKNSNNSNSKQRRQSNVCFADRKNAVSPTSAFTNVSTSFDPSRLVHTNPRLPGATVPFLTGDLRTDISFLWNGPNSPATPSIQTTQTTNKSFKTSKNSNKTSKTSKSRHNASTPAKTHVPDESTSRAFLPPGASSPASGAAAASSGAAGAAAALQPLPPIAADGILDMGADSLDTADSTASSGAASPFLSNEQQQQLQSQQLQSEQQTQQQGYWSIIKKEVLEDQYFPHPLLGLTKQNIDEMQRTQGVPLLPRAWDIKDAEIARGRGKQDNLGFTVLQFNMLADGLSGAYYKDPDNNSKAFLNVNPRCLEWSYRGLRLVQDMLVNSQWNGETPDIIALEECDQFPWLKAYLECYGYEGRFIRKTDTPCTAVAKDLKDAKERAVDIEHLCAASVANAANPDGANNRNKKVSDAENYKFGAGAGANDSNESNELEAMGGFEEDVGGSGVNAKEWDMAPDGCALFWKRSKFRCFDESGIIAKSDEVYLCDSRPNSKGKQRASREDWDPVKYDPNAPDWVDWAQRKEMMLREAQEQVALNEALLGTGDVEKKRRKKAEKELKTKNKFLKDMGKFDVSQVPQDKNVLYEAILSEEKGRVLKQAVTFIMVPLEWIGSNSNSNSNNSSGSSKNSKRSKNSKNEMKNSNGSDKKRFYAMATHLKSTKSREGEKVRVAQLQALLRQGDVFGERLISKERDRFDESLPILFCMDLNGKHNDTYVDEEVEHDEKRREDVKNILYCHEAYDLLTASENEGGLGFESVSVMMNGKEPEYTTWKQRREGPSKHTIDFVFLKRCEKFIRPVAQLGMKRADSSNEALQREVERYENNIKEHNEGLIPDWHYPSDHISLCFRMQFV